MGEQQHTTNGTAAAGGELTTSNGAEHNNNNNNKGDVSINVPANEERRRTASWQDAAFHSVTAMVGAGVLGLPSTFVPLGWIGGIAMLVFSLGVSWYTYGQLVYMHERPLHRRHSVDRRNSATAAAAAAAAASVTDNAGAAAAAVKPPSASASKAERGGVGHPEDDGSGPVLRFDRYQDLTRHVWGPTAGKWALVPFQTAVLVGLGVTYTVAGGDGLHAIASDYTRAGARAPPAWSMYLAFGALQVLLSQLPDFSSLGWVSAVGAAMSVAYSAIGTGLAAAHKSDVRPSYVPKRGANGWATAVEVFAAISTVLFAYGGHNIALEIQATLPRPPGTIKRMMRGVHIAFIATGILYFSVAISGYAALGAATGPNIILAIGTGPSWVRNMARAFVVLHVGAAYQVYSHPLFDWLETAAGSKSRLFSYGSWPSRIALRTVYVGCTTLAAIAIPFFGDLMALIGAIAVTPTTFLLPPLLWLFVRRPRIGSAEWLLNVFLVAATGVVGIMGAISAAYLIAEHARDYKAFAS